MLDSYKLETPPSSNDFTKEDMQLINIKGLVVKAKKKYIDYFDGITEPHNNRFLFETKDDAIEKSEFFGEVFSRLENYYENKMLSEYGRDWIHNAPFDAIID